MRKRFRIALAVLLPLIGCGKAEFKEYTSPAGKFTVLMPGTPEMTTQPLLGEKLVLYQTKVKTTTLAVGYLDLPRTPQATGIPPAQLQKAVPDIAAAHDGRVLSESDFLLEGSPGREFEILSNKPKGYLSGREIVVESRLYELLAMGENARLANPEVQRFLRSFRPIR